MAAPAPEIPTYGIPLKDILVSPEKPDVSVSSSTPERDPQAVEMVKSGSVSKTYLSGSANGSDWDWERIRDFVVAGIELNIGHFPRNPLTEAGIFKGFAGRWGEMAGPIAIYAIDECGAWWQNAPISVNRFCRGSDPYFAEVLAKRLESLTPA